MARKHVPNMVVPYDFKGEISWYELNNRPFLRLHHSRILLHLIKEHHDSAIADMEQHLKWNPSDNIGVRLLICYAYYHAGKKTKAYKCMKKEEENYPPYRYTLALMDIEDGNFVTAAVRLRKAFLENTYIAETLVYGDGIPQKHYLFEGGGDERYDTVEEYRRNKMLPAWRSNKAAMHFLRWLYNTSRSINDRAALTLKKEILSYVSISEMDVRQKAIGDFDNYFKTINERSTETLIRKVESRRHGGIWPWEWDNRL